ncbi:MAG: glycosyltransferase [Bacillota bacterium]|nr:glycosyltransferase [Bacillota bacterium]
MGKKKGYYIHFDARKSIGVSKKIDMQMKAFNNRFCVQEIQIIATPRSLIRRLIGLFPLASITRDYEEAWKKIDNPDFLYVRRTVADHDYMLFLSQIKKKYPRCKIIVEIFTYPYDRDDFGKWNAWPFYLKELIQRKKHRRYIDRFVTYSDDTEIFGVPTIRTTNGVDTQEIKMTSGSYLPNRITLVGVAYMQRQHGYERIIRGLKDYYNKGNVTQKVYLYLVGDGPEKGYYQKLVKRYGLQDYVKLYPTTVGEKLDEIYMQSDIALASFGFYKAGVYYSNSSLKVYECLAKGLPFATGCPIAGIEKECPYMFAFPNNKSVVDIAQIVNEFEKLRNNGRKGKEELAREIRLFAEENFSMEIVMRPIIDYIDEFNASDQA